MKKLAIILLVLISCTKPEENPQPQPIVLPAPTIDNTLYQKVDGTVTTDHSYEIKVYEEMGGIFQETIRNTYTNNTFPYYFEDEISNNFYYEVTLHNFSTFTTQGNGVINATIIFRGDTIFLEADENTWSEITTSPIYIN